MVAGLQPLEPETVPAFRPSRPRRRRSVPFTLVRTKFSDLYPRPASFGELAETLAQRSWGSWLHWLTNIDHQIVATEGGWASAELQTALADAFLSDANKRRLGRTTKYDDLPLALADPRVVAALIQAAVVHGGPPTAEDLHMPRDRCLTGKALLLMCELIDVDHGINQDQPADSPDNERALRAAGAKGILGTNPESWIDVFARHHRMVLQDGSDLGPLRAAFPAAVGVQLETAFGLGFRYAELLHRDTLGAPDGWRAIRHRLDSPEYVGIDQAEVDCWFGVASADRDTFVAEVAASGGPAEDPSGWTFLPQRRRPLLEVEPGISVSLGLAFFNEWLAEGLWHHVLDYIEETAGDSARGDANNALGRVFERYCCGLANETWPEEVVTIKSATRPAIDPPDIALGRDRSLVLVETKLHRLALRDHARPEDWTEKALDQIVDRPLQQLSNRIDDLLAGKLQVPGGMEQYDTVFPVYMTWQKIPLPPLFIPEVGRRATRKGLLQQEHVQEPAIIHVSEWEDIAYGGRCPAEVLRDWQADEPAWRAGETLRNFLYRTGATVGEARERRAEATRTAFREAGRILWGEEFVREWDQKI